MDAQVVIRSGPHEGQRIDVDRELVIGREGDVVINDTQMSRRHAALRPGADGSVIVEDLGSTNGVIVNGRRVTVPVVVRPGDRVEMGNTVLEPVAAGAAPPPAQFQELRANGAIVAFRPGSVAASFAQQVAESVGPARERLKGLIERVGDFAPRIHLVDPFPDAADPRRMVTRGSVVDPEHSVVWMVATAESPPEPPERPLAVLFGSRIPAAVELQPLLEGWALHVSGAPDPDPLLRGTEMPPFGAADGDLGALMAQSFVTFLIARGGEEPFLRLLTSAQPGVVDEALAQAYGQPADDLDAEWRESLGGPSAGVKTTSFMRLAVSYLRPYWKREIELLLLSGFGLAFTVAFPFVLRALLDDAIPSGEFSQVLQLLGILAVAFAVTLVASLRQTYQIVYVGASVIRDIRERMFQRLQQLELGWFSSRDSGDTVARVVTDVELLEAGLAQSMREGVIQSLTLVVTGVTLLILNPLLGAIVLVAAPLVAVIYKVMAAGAQRRSLATQQLVGEVTNVTTENLSGQPVVKAFGLEQREMQRLDETAERLFRSQISLHMFGGLFNVSVQGVTMLLRLIVLGFGAWLVLEGHLTIGGLVAFTSVMGSVLAPVTVLTGIGQQIQQSIGSLVRINEVLDSEPRVAERDDAGELAPVRQSIELRDVAFSYTAERRVLHGVDAVIPYGSRAAFVGPSGAGKSSILQLLTRFADPEQGAVLFDGVDIRDGTLASVRGQTGVVLQETFLFSTSIRENIRLGKTDASDEEVEAAGRAARLDELIAQQPDGWDADVGERGGKLSGGQRQRVAIARALVRDPALLLLDEATSALDPRTEHEITDTLDEVASGRTTVAITHRLASVRDYDRIFVVVEGRIAEHGTHDELIAAGGVYADLWAEQHGELTAGAPTFEIRSALARLPLFEDLDDAELGIVESALRPLELGSGQRLPEGGGRLALVTRGAGLAMVPGVGGGLVRIAELRAGQAFGLSALLGDETGALLEADGPVSLLVLDDEAMRALAARLPGLDAVLAGRRTEVNAPVTGVRLADRSAVLSRPSLDILGTPRTVGRSSGGTHRIVVSGDAGGVMSAPPMTGERL